MFKRMMLLTAIAAFAVAVMASPAMAAKGGIWRAHPGVESGQQWGAAVSGLAKSSPGALAAHIQAVK